MPAFRYVALDAAGAVRRGVIEAASEAEVIDRVRREGSLPMRCEPAERRGGGSLRELLTQDFGRGGALRRQEVAHLTRELAIMLAAGQDLDRALRFLVETAPNRRMREVLGSLREAVRDGSSFAAALGRHPRSFPRLYVGLVRAGEAGGKLAPALDHLAALLERERSLAATVTSAMVYPSLLMLAALGSITLLLTYVLPQFVPMFAESGVALPRPTQILIDVGAFVSSYGLLLLLAVVALGLTLRAALRLATVRLAADRLLLRVPIVGGLAREVLAARFGRTFGTLLLNGMPLVGALAVVRDVLGNQAAIEAADRAALVAKGGGGLADPLGRSGIFPPHMIHLLRLGEETARLGEMSLRAAEIHEERTRLGVQRLVSLLVPGITIVMGAAVTGIVSSLLLAMLSLNDLAH